MRNYTQKQTVYRNMKNRHSGAHYLLEGLRLVRQPGLRRYVIIPLLISTLVFAGNAASTATLAGNSATS